MIRPSLPMVPLCVIVPADDNPIRPSSERAREAGRRWEAEIQERERQRETGEDE